MPSGMVRVGDPFGGEPVTGSPDERREQSQGDNNSAPDADRRGDPHDGEERDLGDPERQQRDRDGGAGEDDGRARGAGGLRCGFVGVQALGEQVPMPGDDEQRVVDPDRQPDHQGQEGCGRGDRGEPGREQDERHRHRHPEQGRQQRYAGRDRRPEGEHEHDQRDDDPQALGDAHFWGGGHEERSTDRGGQARGGGFLGQGDERLPGRVGHLGGVDVELDGDDPGRAVRGHGAFDVLVEGAGRAADVREGGIPGGEALDAGGDGGVGDLGAGGGGDDDLTTGPGELGEARGEGVHGPLRLGAGDLEDVGHAALQQTGAGAEDHDEGHPDRHDEAATSDRPVAKGIED